MYLPIGDNLPPEVFASVSICTWKKKKVEPAGRVFEQMISKKNKQNLLDEILLNENEESANNQVEEDTTEYFWEKIYKENQKNDPFKIRPDNYYKILGLEDLYIKAKTEDIRKAYKKLAVIYHPDKNIDNIDLSKEEEDNNKPKTEQDELIEESELTLEQKNKKEMTEEEKKKYEINQKWLQIKEAYENLLDPAKRKKYISSMMFDDSIPEEDKTYNEQSFFIEFGPVFIKNAIWSKKQPVPKLGDMDSPIDKVKKFYRFWYNFESWREFSVEGEYNIDEANSRYEKRQMMKENKKMKSNLLREEKERIGKLVQTAYQNDPRIIAEEARLKKEREEEKKRRMEEKIREKEEEEERFKKLQEERERQKELQKQQLMAEKQNLTDQILNIAKDLKIEINKEELFNLNLNSKIETLKNVIDECNKEENIQNKKKTFVNLCKVNFAMKIKCDTIDDDKDSKLWTKEEIALLQKGVKKFPAGTKDRWNKIREIVKTKENEQIVQMTHYLLTNPNIKVEQPINLDEILRKDKKSATPANTNEQTHKTATENKDKVVWTNEDQKLFEAALKKYPSSLPVNERWTNIANDVPGKTKKQCVERYKYLASLVKKAHK